MCLPSGFQGSVRNLALHRREMVEGLVVERNRRNSIGDGVGRWIFNHGLGDAIMLRSVLEHCRQPIKLQIPDECHYSRLFDDLPHVSVVGPQERAQGFKRMRFYTESYDFQCVSGRKTKPRICLEKEMRVFDPSVLIKPRSLDLSHVNTPETRQTDRLVSSLGDYAVVHVQGCSDRGSAPPLWLAYYLSKKIVETGLGCLVLNYDFGYRFGSTPDLWFIGVDGIQSTKGWPLGAECMWRALRGAKGLVGIDSGPLHMAMAIKGLPCVHVKGRLDFRNVFYDGGTDNIKAAIDADSSFEDIDQSLENFMQ